jgi:hypothetical protein
VVFVREVAAGLADMVLLSANGEQVMTTTGNENNPVWSPDGTQIAYDYYDGTSRFVYVMNADGSNVRRLNYYQGSNPTWSPNGEWIVYVNTSGDLSYVNSDCDGTASCADYVLFDSSSPLLDPAWSPTSGTLMMVERNPYSDLLRQVTITESGGFLSASNQSLVMNADYVAAPAWSPNGNALLIEVKRESDLSETIERWNYSVTSGWQREQMEGQPKRYGRQPTFAKYQQGGTATPTPTTTPTGVPISDALFSETTCIVRIIDPDLVGKVLQYPDVNSQIVADLSTAPLLVYGKYTDNLGVDWGYVYLTGGAGWIRLTSLTTSITESVEGYETGCASLPQLNPYPDETEQCMVFPATEAEFDPNNTCWRTIFQLFSDYGILVRGESLTTNVVERIREDIELIAVRLGNTDPAINASIFRASLVGDIDEIYTKYSVVNSVDGILVSDSQGGIPTPTPRPFSYPIPQYYGTVLISGDRNEVYIVFYFQPQIAIHEFGHVVHYLRVNLNDYIALLGSSCTNAVPIESNDCEYNPGPEFPVSDYGGENGIEDFAEAFRYFVVGAEASQILAPSPVTVNQGTAFPTRMGYMQTIFSNFSTEQGIPAFTCSQWVDSYAGLNGISVDPVWKDQLCLELSQ